MKKTITILVFILFYGWTNVMATVPSLSQSPYSFSFGNVLINTTATTQNFLITGTSLSNADIIVSAVAGLTYSTTLGGTYTTTLTLSQPGGTYSQTVYVKFTPTLAKQYSGSISFNGGGNLTAKTITISGRGVTPVHFVTVAGAGTKDGSSWANAHDGTQIQAAINDSLVTAVWLAAGTYFPTSGTDRTIAFKMKNGVAIYGGFAGTETFFSQRNIATNVTILSGDIGTVGDSTDNSYNVIFNSNIIANRQLVAPAILDGFTIKNGCANNLVLDIKYTQGGAMHIDGLSALNVRNCVFEHNSATMGGALYVAGSQLAAYTMQSIAILPVFTNCIFRYNYFNAIYNQGGGAVYNNYATPIFTNCLFYGNIASQGGAIIEAANSPGSTYNNCTFTANLASKTDYYNGGGAIAIANNGYSNLYNCIVWGNTSLSLSYNKGHQFALSSGGITLNYSCYSYGPGDILTSNGVFTATNNNITSNPMFVNPSTNDYRLYDISPCLDAGNDSYNAETYDIRGIGYSRNLLKTDSNTVGTIDMGAYEFKNGFDPPCVLAISSQSTAAQSQCLNGTYNTISVEATGNGLTYQWYSNASNSNSGGTSLVAANGAQTNSYTPQSATVGTAYYYCVVTNVCGSDTTLISGKFITSAPTAISSQSTAPQTRCFNGTYNAITVTVAGSNVYQWYRNTTADTIAGFAVGTNSYSYTPLADTVGTRYYYCKITVGCGAPITSLVSGAFITNALPVPTISGNTSACINSTGNVYTTEAGMTAYNWSINGGTITAGSTTNSVTVTWTASGAKSISVNYTNTNSCTAATATVYNVTVFPLFTTGVIATTGETICYNGNPAIIGSTTVASGGNDTITYAWYKSTTNFIDSTLIGSNTSTYDPPTNLTITTSYRRYAHDGRCNTFFIVSSGTWTVTVNPASNGGNISGGANVCNGINSTVLTLSGHTGSVVKWQYTINGGYNWYDINNTGTTNTATNLITTTSFRAVVKSGVCDATPGGYANVTVQSVVTAGTIATAQTICNNTTPVALTSATAGTGSNTISYEWQTNTSGSYVNIGSATAATYQPPTLTATTSYQRRTVSTNGSNACYSSYTSPITMTVYSAFASGAITTTGETICYNTNPITEIGNSTLSSGGDNSITYSWKSSADGYISAISGATSSTYTPAGPLTTTTSYQRYVKDNTCNITPEVSTGIWTVTVRDNFTSGTIASTGEAICYNTNPSTEIGNTTLASGGDNSITYEWRSSADSYSSAISGAIAATYTPAGPLTSTTSYQRYAKDNTCNTTPEVSTEIWTVTVNPLPVPTISGPTGICNNSTDNVYTTESGKTSYVWTVPGGTITAGAGTNAITVTWNNDGAQTVSVNYANTYGCTAVSATVYNVTVKAAPSPVITGSPDNLYNVPKLATYQYSTPFVAGDLYSWSSPKIEGYCSASARNCVNVHFLDPCCVYGQWTISVTETNPTSGCTSIATKQIYITP